MKFIIHETGIDLPKTKFIIHETGTNLPKKNTLKNISKTLKMVKSYIT